MSELICPNREINQEMCVCVNKECQNWGICCLCVTAHRQGGSLTSCMRRPRPEATLELAGTGEPCPRQSLTVLNCACSYEPCGRRGICCECLRNHWTADGTGRPACFAQ